MKQIEIRNFETIKDQDNSPICYGGMIKEIICSLPTDGIHIEDMRTRLKILDVLDSLETTDNSVITLDDAECTMLAHYVKAYKWKALNKELIEFSDYITSL